MMHAPALTEINAAEARVAQYKHETRASLYRANGALRATIERTTAMTLIAGTAGLLILWRLRRKQRQINRASREQGLAPRRSSRGVMLGFILRYGVQGLSFMLRRFQTAWQARRPIDNIHERDLSVDSRPLPHVHL
jgi:hypothetical protein